MVLLSGSVTTTRACGVRGARDARRALRPLHAETSQMSSSLRATSSFLLPVFDRAKPRAVAAGAAVVAGARGSRARLRSDGGNDRGRCSGRGRAGVSADFGLRCW